MPPYTVTFARSVRKELQALPKHVASRILDKIESLAFEPRPIVSTKLQGPSQLWRFRVGEYRVTYDIDDKKHIVDITVVRHRSEAYR